MVTQQVLRDAVAVPAALALVLGWTAGGGAAFAQAGPSGAAAASGASAASDETEIAVVDLGPGDAATRRERREELEAGLGRVTGLRVSDDAALRTALAGERLDPQAEEGRARLAAAAAALGRPDCPAAAREAEAAVLALAASQAGGAGVAAELRQGHVYLLLCADQAGEVAAAQRAAAALRALDAPDPPDGVPAAVWSRYPAFDATGGVRRFQLDVSSKPDGATIWIDHAPVGVAPLAVLLPEGEHLVAAAKGGASVARRVTLQTYSSAVALALPATARPWRAIEARVRGWRAGAIRRTPASLAQVLARARLEYAVVIDERGRLEVFHRRRGQALQQLGVARDPVEVGAMVARTESQRRSPGIDPEVPLLVESPQERAARAAGNKATPRRQEWWVYAAIAGAVAVGAGIVLLNDLADDHQRIEVTFP
jgi:hypothetical protein